jgi:hypothetical protein
VPRVGLAKTFLVRSVADATHLTFRRVQFTPDLVPSDVTGTEVMEEDPVTRRRDFRFVGLRLTPRAGVMVDGSGANLECAAGGGGAAAGHPAGMVTVNRDGVVGTATMLTSWRRSTAPRHFSLGMSAAARDSHAH